MKLKLPLKKISLYCFFMLGNFLPIQLFAQQDGAFREKVSINYSLGIGMSTTGISAEAAAGISERIKIKLGGHFLSYSYSNYLDQTSFIYHMQMRLASVSLVAEWHPFFNAANFYGAGGLFYNQNSIKYDVRSDGDLAIGNLLISPEDSGTLNMNFYANKIAPYIGIGYGKTFNTKKWGWLIEAGSMFIGVPHVDIEGKGLIAPIAEQKSIIEKNISQFKYYPVLTGLLYYKIH